MTRREGVFQVAKKKNRKFGGPFLAAAVFCDSFLEDTSGKISAVGILDGCSFFISPDAPSDVPSKTHPALINQNILLIFRSGDAPGKHKLKFVVEQPDGKRTTALERDLNLSEPPHGGVNLKTVAQFGVYTSGIYWVDVYLDGKRVTRMPLNVTFQRLSAQPVQDQEQSKARTKG